VGNLLLRSSGNGDAEDVARSIGKGELGGIPEGERDKGLRLQWLFGLWLGRKVGRGR